MLTSILYCCDPINPRTVDEHFAAEAASVRAAGATVALLDHDELLAGDAEAAVRRVPRDAGPVWYRGWMVPAERYQQLAVALARRGVDLVVGPTSYRTAHELPGWYATFMAKTPRSVWMPTAPGAVPDVDALAALLAPLGTGAAVVKDYVKSRKHEWDEACYVPNLTDVAHVHRVVARFVELQEEFLVGGIVVRSFEPFTTEGEARVWWLDGDPIVVGPHPDSPESLPSPPLDDVRGEVRALGARFITTDMAQRTDGTWRVVEVGDGQVSDLPRTVDPALLTAALIRA